jgi:predicted RNase H-like nuclease (RuvC/YqgF family)
MVYAKYITCNSCGENKQDTEFYKTIKGVCKMCRDQQMREERQRFKEHEIIDIKRAQNFKNLKRTVAEQSDIIGDMKAQIKTMRRNMADMREELEELSDLKARMKGMTLGRLKAKSG